MKKYLLTVYFFILSSFLYYGFAAKYMGGDFLSFSIYTVVIAIPFGFMITHCRSMPEAANITKDE